MSPPVVADVFHRAWPRAAMLHGAVLRARLRQLYAGRRHTADPARDLEWCGVSGLPRCPAERCAPEALRRMRHAVEPLTPRVAAVIPTLNEATTIAGTIAMLPRSVVDEII